MTELVAIYTNQFLCFLIFVTCFLIFDENNKISSNPSTVEVILCITAGQFLLYVIIFLLLINKIN